MSDLKQTEALYEKTGAVDCLIINASVQFRTPWYEIGDEEMDTQLNVNFKSTLKLMQAYYPAMKENGFGRIVTIGSVQQFKPHKDMAYHLQAATRSDPLTTPFALQQIEPNQIWDNNMYVNYIAIGC